MKFADVASMDARFVMSRLVLWRKPLISTVVLKSAVLANEPFSVVVWRLDKSAHVGCQGLVAEKSLAFLNASSSVLAFVRTCASTMGVASMPQRYFRRF